jgi:general secretion pathway protein D
MSLRPTISRVAKRVADPGVALTAADLNVDVESTIPVVEVREMDSVITVDDGQILVLGGLMQERVTNTDSSVPKASDIPVIGNAFKSKSKKSELTELIIFLKTTIVQGNNSVSKADKNIYQKYTPDSRPIAF